MSQIGRPIKSLEAPRPLKSLSRPTLPSATYEVQSIEELITLTENVAAALGLGQSNADSMSILLANLRVHGPQLEVVSKDTLDRAFVTFRNASQDERLTIIARMNLLELIELRAKSWQISDGLHTYYKHKATDVQPDFSAMLDLSMLGTSPPNAGGVVAAPMLNPGELLRNSGKFTKPTKIPGKNYSKDEVVIRNADSGKVMGIKGRRVHMIEELSETIISFQRVNAGAKERLVQITGPSEDKIVYAKQLIEDTIRRNASPVRLDAPQGGGSCSSLASSASDEAAAVAAVAAAVASAGSTSSVVYATTAAQQQHMLQHTTTSTNHVPMTHGVVGGGFQHVNNSGTGSNAAASNANGGLPTLKMMMPPRTHHPHHHHQQQQHSPHQLLHSLSTNDASLGEYKYTVGVGAHSVKITGDCFELVRIAKLVLDDYFSSADFLASVEAGAAYAEPSTPTTPAAHQLNASGSPFADSGIGLNYRMGGGGGGSGLGPSVEVDDEVFVAGENHTSPDPSGAAPTASSTPQNGLTRSRRSHFSRKDSTPELASNATTTNTSGGNNAKLTTPSAAAAASAIGRAATIDQQQLQLQRQQSAGVVVESASGGGARIVHEYERMLYYAKSPHSWALPKNWAQICEQFPLIVRRGQDLVRFDPDKHLQQKKSGKQSSPPAAASSSTGAAAASVDEEPAAESSPSPDPQ